MGKETSRVMVAVAVVTCLAAYLQMHYGVMQRFHGEGGVRHDLHTSRHKDRLWDKYHRPSASEACAPCPSCGESSSSGGADRSATGLDDAGGDDRGVGTEDEDRGGGMSSADVTERPSAASSSSSSSSSSSYDRSWNTRGLSVVGKDLETISLKEELRTAKERIEELTALLNIKCVVKDFTQCASACAHRIMRHKQFLSQCQATLQRRGCPDPSLQVARVLAKDRLAMRRATYSLLGTALKAKAQCTRPDKRAGFEALSAVTSTRRGSAEAIAAAEAGLPAAAVAESRGDAQDKEEMLVAALERSVIMRDAGASAAEDVAGALGGGVTAEAFDDIVNGGTARADEDDGSAETEWIAQVRERAADPTEGFFRNAGVRLAADDKDLPPAAYLRHDLGAELGFPELYGIGRKFFRAVSRGGPGLAFLTPRVGLNYATCAVVGNSQTMLSASRGAEIDAHGVVVRLNNAPTLGFERFVGGRTTHRLLNGVWTQRYASNAIESNHVANVMPLEVGVTAVATRALAKDYQDLGDAIRARGRRDVSLSRLSDEFVARAGVVLKTLRDRLESLRGVEGGAAGREREGNGVPYPGKASPSSGFVSIFFLLQMCKNVTVYGIGADNDGHARSTNWHYWENADYYATSREFGDAPHHSWELERDVLAALDAGLPGFRLVGPKERGPNGAGGRATSRRRAGGSASGASDLAVGAELGETAAGVVFKANKHMLAVREKADKACAAVSTSRCGCSDPNDAGAGLLTAAGKSTSSRNRGATRLTPRQENTLFGRTTRKHDDLVILKAINAVAGKTAPAGGSGAPSKPWSALVQSVAGARGGKLAAAAAASSEAADEVGDAGIDDPDEDTTADEPDLGGEGGEDTPGDAPGAGGVFSRLFGGHGHARRRAPPQ